MSLQQAAFEPVRDDLRSRPHALTDTPAIDTSPSYAPDGGRICFESDRGGNPQMYVMPATAARATHFVRRGQLFDAGVVAARRLHRLHQAGWRASSDRHHEAGWLGRTHPHLGLPNEGPTLRRTAVADVLPRTRRQQRSFAVHRRYLGPTVAGSDPGFASDPAWSRCCRERPARVSQAAPLIGKHA